MRRINLAGQKFGRLTVVCYDGYRNGEGRWWCICECGEKRVNGSHDLRNGKVKSCGCWQSDFMKSGGGNKKHGMWDTSTYATWQGLKGRCYNTKNAKYSDYGGRGITVCDRWRNSFESFLADMGEKPKGKTIDRKNNDGNYEPDNCRWATPVQQRNNRRPCSTYARFTVNGFHGTIPEIAVHFNISKSALCNRVHTQKMEINKAVKIGMLRSRGPRPQP